MESSHHRYQLALRLIAEESYLEAKPLLEACLLDSPHDATLHWALGLIEAATGYPYEALQHWRKVDPAQFEGLKTQQALVESQLEAYAHLYRLYEDALVLIRGEQYEEAQHAFKQLLSVADGLPLPLPFYQGYGLLLYLHDQKDAVASFLLEAPTYVRQAEGLRSIISRFAGGAAPVSAVSTEKSPWRNRLAVASVIGFALLTGAVGGSLIASTNTAVQPAFNEQSATAIEHKEQLLAKDAELSRLKEQAAAEEQKRLELDALLIEMTEKLHAYQKQEEIYQLAGYNLTAAQAQAAEASYELGLKAYRNGNYSDADRFFTRSLSLSDSYYFSDDSYFYGIQTKRSLGQLEALEPMVDEFLNHELEVFQQSPYYDDVMLEKAALLLQASKASEAQRLLIQLIERYPGEWTSKRAQQWLQELEGGSQ